MLLSRSPPPITPAAVDAAVPRNDPPEPKAGPIAGARRDPEDTAASAGDILAAVYRAEPLKIVFVRALMVREERGGRGGGVGKGNTGQ